MSKTIAIVQSNYLPWRGYFDLMRHCDLFVIGDTVKYTKEDWRNRNIIKTASGPKWLTIPVHYKLRESPAIDQVNICDPCWASKHIRELGLHYGQAAAFSDVSRWLFALLENAAGEALLSRVNTYLLVEIAARLRIRTPIIQSSEVIPREILDPLEKNQRALAICKALGVTRYLSGPAAKNYLDEELFRAHGIEVAWMSYDGYAPYSQLWGAFDPKVSIVDLLLNTGVAAETYFPPIPAPFVTPSGSSSSSSEPTASTVAR